MKTTAIPAPTPDLGNPAVRVVQSVLTPQREPSQIPPAAPRGAFSIATPADKTNTPVVSKMDEDFPNIDSLVRELDDFDL